MRTKPKDVQVTTQIFEVSKDGRIISITQIDKKEGANK